MSLTPLPPDSPLLQLKGKSKARVNGRPLDFQAPQEIHKGGRRPLGSIGRHPRP